MIFVIGIDLARRPFNINQRQKINKRKKVIFCVNFSVKSLFGHLFCVFLSFLCDSAVKKDFFSFSVYKDKIFKKDYIILPTNFFFVCCWVT